MIKKEVVAFVKKHYVEMIVGFGSIFGMIWGIRLFCEFILWIVNILHIQH